MKLTLNARQIVLIRKHSRRPFSDKMKVFREEIITWFHFMITVWGKYVFLYAFFSWDPINTGLGKKLSEAPKAVLSLPKAAAI